MSPDTPLGLYRDGRKLAAFGISLHHGISAHGVAVYLEPQLAWFEGIHPCGVPGAKPISLAELGVSLPWNVAAERLAASLKNSFQAPRT
jgi:lipoyl(octanoyl) transferase